MGECSDHIRRRQKSTTGGIEGIPKHANLFIGILTADAGGHQARKLIAVKAFPFFDTLLGEHRPNFFLGWFVSNEIQHRHLPIMDVQVSFRIEIKVTEGTDGLLVCRSEFRTGETDTAWY